MARKRMANKSNRRMVQCATVVNREAVRRETINGIEHVIVSSFTLPDNIVMNGGLYPADEIAAGFPTLEGTLAPVEHPTDLAGSFISATDAHAIHNFHAGASNKNVTRENGRVHVEKHINVQEAMKTDRGKRLIDRITELETNEDARPIHTSVGVFLDVEFLDKPQTNAMGQEYSWIARDMVFDHDAILLDSVGAAQPSQGVGMAVNADGDECQVDRALVKADDFRASEELIASKEEAKAKFEADKERIQQSIANQLEAVLADVGDISFSDIMNQLDNEIRATVGAEWSYVVDVQGDQVIFETNTGLFTVPWRLDDGVARIVGIPIRVDRVVTFIPKTNSEGDAMKELMLKALADAGISVNADISDEELMAKYNELQANQSAEGGDNGAAIDEGKLAEVVANAVKPLSEEIASLKANQGAQEDKQRGEYADVIVNSGRYPELDKDSALLLPTEKLKDMAANCGTAHGISLNADLGGQGNSNVPTEMPE
jgi:hypothetical protein